MGSEDTNQQLDRKPRSFTKAEYVQMACVGSERHNVFTVFQKVNCPHTAKVVNKDGPVVERHEMRPHDITIDASEGFNAVVATLWAPGHCMTSAPNWVI